MNVQFNTHQHTPTSLEDKQDSSRILRTCPKTSRHPSWWRGRLLHLLEDTWNIPGKPDKSEVLGFGIDHPLVQVVKWSPWQLQVVPREQLLFPESRMARISQKY